MTARQREALVWIARGYTADQAARRMGISRDTVLSHLKRIYARLGARTGPHAVALAMVAGLIHPADINPPQEAAA